MVFYTKDECEAWLIGRGRVLPNLTPDIKVEHMWYPPEHYQVFFFAQWIASNLTFRQPVLLFLTEWGVWTSTENSHLYYKLRQSYGDNRLYQEAPGHLFLGHEAEDLASFLQLSMLNGWGGYVLTGADYVNAFFSHDEWIDFYASTTNQHQLDTVREALGKCKAAYGKRE